MITSEFVLSASINLGGLILTDYIEVAKYIKVILLKSEVPLSYPDIQKALYKYNIELSELDILKALKEIPKADKKQISEPLDPTRDATEDRNPKFLADIDLKRKHMAKMCILSRLLHNDEMHISKVEELLSNMKAKLSLAMLLDEMGTEDLIRFKTTDHNFITIASAGKDYLNIFQ